MATILSNIDGSFGLILTTDEQDTWARLPVGQLDAYITLWLNERGKTVLSERFEKLTIQDKVSVMATLKSTDAVKG